MANIKENIRAKAIYDENQANNYYILSFSVFEYEFPVKNANGKNTKLLSICWTFYKPKTEVETFVLQHPETQTDFTLLKQTKLPVENIVCLW